MNMYVSILHLPASLAIFLTQKLLEICIFFIGTKQIILIILVDISALSVGIFLLAHAWESVPIEAKK